MKTLTIFDTFGFFFRNYYALPYLKSSDGFPTGLLTGFANFIYTLEKDFPTDYVLFALDSSGKNFRHELDENYKANRKEAPEDLKRQLPVAINWIDKMGFKSFSKEGFEADDIIASAVKFAKENDLKVRIVTHDKDLYQLIDDGRVVVFDPIKKIEIDEQKCKEKFGVPPSKIGDYLSIVGDSADNIPGVKGIGDKGAKKLLGEFESVEEIYENLDKVLNKRAKKLLEESKESAFLSKKLVQLDSSIDLSDKFENFKFPKDEPLLKIADELEKYGLKSILNRLKVTPKTKKQDEVKFEPILLDTKEKLFEVVDNLKDIVAFDTETTGVDSKVAKLVGFSFAADLNRAYYVPISHNYLDVGKQVGLEVAKEAIEKIFTCRVVGQNLKYDFAIVKNNLSVSPAKNYEDTMLLAWLLNPSMSVGLDNLAKRFFNYEMVKFKDVVKKGQNFSHVELSEACLYASEDAWMTLRLWEKLRDMLEPNLLKVAKEVEFPFVLTLLEMEEEGIGVDLAYFEELQKRAEESISRLKREIFGLCGLEFNLNSPKQLGEVLFEQLKLPVQKKTKSGFSTDESVLLKLKDEHEAIEKILEYREVFKLYSTYIKPLLALAKKSKNQRVHTSFLQTGTSTGRLSSKDPNLQNIPTKTELGRQIRYGFKPTEGYSFVGIDYSQIELRLLAHYSKDEELLKAFNNDLDIHTQTAIKLFTEEEAKAKRGIAKSINFGLLYGMGARKLAQTLGVSQAEAKGYIESYFKSFPTVREYLESIKEEAKKEGFVTTLLGRKRHFDFENANGMQLATYEREAVNTRFQGSAADLIKLSMNAIREKLLNSESKMLLQIHDELIFEVRDELCEEFACRAKEIMESIYSLNVKLKATVEIGKSWGELK